MRFFDRALSRWADFTGSNGSPLISAGTYVGNLLDASCKRFSRTPTIGAYEYVRPRQPRL